MIIYIFCFVVAEVNSSINKFNKIRYQMLLLGRYSFLNTRINTYVMKLFIEIVLGFGWFLLLLLRCWY
jgi:hypothetical protein